MFINNNIYIDVSFIERAKKLYKDKDNRRYEKEYKKKYFNTEKGIIAKKKYAESEKGKEAIKRKDKKRQENFKKACDGLSWEEKKLIGDFYKNCPEGYEVDHIIPISKGGQHRLSNLQYLTPEENSRKANKI